MTQTITILITTMHTVASSGKHRVVIYLRVENDININKRIPYILPRFAMVLALKP